MTFSKFKKLFKLEIKPSHREHFSSDTPVSERARILGKEILSARVGIGLSLLFVLSVVTLALFLPFGENSILNIQFNKKSSSADYAVDINKDGKVDMTDINLLIQRFRSNDPTADFDKNSIVDLRDLSIVLTQMSNPTGTPMITPTITLTPTVTNTPTQTPTLTPTQPPTPQLTQLRNLITVRDRNGIKTWAGALTISQLNTTVSQLNQTEKDNLADIVLVADGDVSSQVATARSMLLTAVKKILSKDGLGFYTEIFSYTTYHITGNGYFGSCNQVWLGFSAISSSYQNSPDQVRDVVMHESFHSFNCINGGPNGALNEGSAIWVYKTPFPEGRFPQELAAGWAESTFGTVNYMRDIGVNGYTGATVVEAPPNPTQKLIDVYNWLSANDPSKLPWLSTTKLNICYQKYYQDLNRNVDFNVWLVGAVAASQQMAADINCH